MGIEHLAPGTHELKILANWFTVPDRYLGNGDLRPLAFRLRRLELGRAPAGRAAA